MLVLLSGVSGAGKDTIKRELIKRNTNITSLPSYTDREPREGEVNGEIYNFISTQEFEELIKNGDLYEYDVHHDHYYGTSKHLLNERLESGKIIVKDIEVNGTENLVKLLKEGMWDLATCANGEPNVVPVAFKDVTDDGKLVVGDVFLETTLNNIKANDGKIAISVYKEAWRISD